MLDHFLRWLAIELPIAVGFTIFALIAVVLAGIFMAIVKTIHGAFPTASVRVAVVAGVCWVLYALWYTFKVALGG